MHACDDMIHRIKAGLLYVKCTLGLELFVADVHVCSPSLNLDHRSPVCIVHTHAAGRTTYVLMRCMAGADGSSDIELMATRPRRCRQVVALRTYVLYSASWL